MQRKRLFQTALVMLMLVTLTSILITHSNAAAPTGTLVETLRQGLGRFQELEAAKQAGYGLFHGCMSSPQTGAMGVHFVNGDLVGDGEVDALHPEALLYEPKNGKLQLVGVEYVVIAEDWDTKHEEPPVVMGQMFNYTSAPNRLRIPAFYSLHVWAWQNNPSGMFADFNPKVSCEAYISDDAMSGHH